MARVDHAQRRQQIVDAVWRLLEKGGVEAASVRGVVAETGLSSGSIRFFFSSQAGLHEFAMVGLAERVRERIRRATEEPDPRKRALGMVEELMPLREDTEREFGIWLDFVGRSRHHPELAAIVAEQASQVREFLAGLLTDLVTLGLRSADTDIESEASHLNALIDGLTLEVLTAPGLVSPTQARTILERLLFPAGASERGRP